MGGCATNLSDIPVLSGFITTDEEAIARVMNDVQRGMESRRIYRVLAHVSPNYYDAEGRDYKAIESYLGEVLRTYAPIHIDRARPRVVVEGNKARVVETFGTRAEPLPASTEVPVAFQGQVTVYLQKEGDAWKIVEWGYLG